eukprot:m.204629 g.204629  ORF g.204629 m.204629 type:complete len:55 (+) comp32894_c2_seq1:95-259(+)
MRDLDVCLCVCENIFKDLSSGLEVKLVCFKTRIISTPKTSFIFKTLTQKTNEQR